MIRLCCFLDENPFELITESFLCLLRLEAVNTSAPVIHKVGSIEQLPVEINWK